MNEAERLPPLTKPCPFCGGINIIYNRWYACYCHTCGAEGPDADHADEAEAVAHWNQRPASPRVLFAGHSNTDNWLQAIDGIPEEKK